MEMASNVTVSLVDEVSVMVSGIWSLFKSLTKTKARHKAFCVEWFVSMGVAGNDLAVSEGCLALLAVDARWLPQEMPKSTMINHLEFIDIREVL